MNNDYMIQRMNRNATGTLLPVVYSKKDEIVLEEKERRSGQILNTEYHVIFSTYTECRLLFRLSPTFWTFWSISSIFVRAAYILNEIGSKLLIINNNNFITNDEDADQES